jgi:ACS family D-galactonate transporter-like MFS transporter
MANRFDAAPAEGLLNQRTLARTRALAIVPLLMTIALVSQFNRYSMAKAGVMRIMPQYSISPTRMGMIYSAFLVTYTIFMIPGGLFIDRFGTRAALMMVCFSSALFVTLTGVVGLTLSEPGSIFLALLLVRGLMGIFSAPLHPSGARAVGTWVPPTGRSRTNGMINGAALVGIAASPPLFGAMIKWLDWPLAFVVMGVVTLILGLVWTVLAADAPESEQVPEEMPDASTAWHTLLQSPGLMLVTLSYACVGYFQYMFFYWVDYYFEKVLNLPTAISQNYAAIPPLAMAVGMPLGGWLSDKIEHARGTPSSRKIVPMLGISAGAVLLFVGVYAREPAWIVMWFSLAFAAVGMAEGPCWATAVDLGGRRGGAAAGILNTGGNAGGFLAPYLTPLIGQHYGWGPAVTLGGVICLSGALAWLWIDPQEKRRDLVR